MAARDRVLSASVFTVTVRRQLLEGVSEREQLRQRLEDDAVPGEDERLRSRALSSSRTSR